MQATFLSFPHILYPLSNVFTQGLDACDVYRHSLLAFRGQLLAKPHLLPRLWLCCRLVHRLGCSNGTQLFNVMMKLSRFFPLFSC